MTYELPYSGEKYDIGSYDQDCCIYSKAEGSIASFSDGAEDYPMKSVVAQIVPIQEGTGDPSPDNVRPISGWDGVNVYRTGINVWDEQWEVGSFTTQGQPASSDTTIRSKNFIPIIPNTEYYFHCGKVGAGICLFWYDENKQFIAPFMYIPSGIDRVYTSPSNAKWCKFRAYNPEYGNVYLNDISINYPATDRNYHPYQGSSKYIPFKDSEDNPITVYGGEIDVVSGEGKDNRIVFNIPHTATWRTWGVNANTQGITGFYAYMQSFLTDEQIMSLSTLTNCNCLKPNTGVWGGYRIGAEGNLGSDSPAGRYEMFGVQNDTIGILDTDTNDEAIAKWMAFIEANGLQVVHLVTTPTPIYCEPTEIKTLKGNNNVWCDTGDISVEYLAQLDKDTMSYSGQKYHIGSFEPIEGEESPHAIPYHVGIYEPITEESRESIDYIIL